MGHVKEYWRTLVFAVAVIVLSGEAEEAQALSRRDELLVVSDGASIEIMPSNPIVAKYVGESYVATCNTSAGAKANWFVGRSHPIRGGTAGSVVPGSAWRAGIGHQIVIKPIEKKDHGEYCCRTTDGRKPAEKCFELNVLERIAFRDTPEEQNATEGKDVVIKCEVTGDPTPEIQWKVNGQPWKGTQYEQLADGLLIKNVTVQDQGVYECLAIQMSEQVSDQDFRNISLRVLHRPKWKESQTSKNVVFGYLSGEVNLTCAVSADPPATIQWFTHKDSQQLIEPLAPRIILEENKATLRVKLSNTSVFGKYRCRAKNGVGAIAKEIFLQQGFKPKPPQQVKLMAVSATTAEFDVHTPVVGPKVQQSTHKSGSATNNSNSNSGGGGGGGNRSASINDTLGYRVRLTRLTNGTDHTFERECEPAPCRLLDLTPGSNYTMRIATKGKAGLSDWVAGPMFQTAAGAQGLAPLAPILAVALVAAAALLAPPSPAAAL